MLRQGVTLGVLRTNERGAPRIGNRVDIGAGAKILGSVTIGDKKTFVQRGELAMLMHGQQLSIEAVDTANLIVVGATPLNEPIARYGPFVMNTREEIYKAFEDYQAGRM